MRNEPFGVCGVAVESASEVIVDSALGHLAASVSDDFESLLIAGSIIRPQEKLKGHRRRELWRAPKAAVVWIEVSNNSAVCIVQQVSGQLFAGFSDGAGALQL